MDKLMRYVAFVLLMAGLFLVGCAAVDPPRNIEYTVKGSAPTSFITYQSEGGSTEQVEASSGWKHTFSAKRGAFVYVAAQKQGEEGAVEVEIRVNGDVFKTARSTAGYGIATASGMVP